MPAMQGLSCPPLVAKFKQRIPVVCGAVKEPLAKISWGTQLRFDRMCFIQHRLAGRRLQIQRKL